MGYLTDSSIVLNQTEGIISISQIFGIPYVIFVGSNCEDTHVPEASLQMDYSKGRATSQVERKPMNSRKFVAGIKDDIVNAT